MDILVAPPFRLTPKVLRKTFACNQLILSQLGLGGMGLIQLQDALGHERLDVTRVHLADVHKYLNVLTQQVNTQDAAQAILEWKRQKGLA